MSSSEGVSVWFACKLCKSFFLNADDFAYHKKKSHLHEFRHTKFIVFEERSTPTVSPPENCLTPREETKFHKIISSTSSPTITNVDCHAPNENTEDGTSKEFTDQIGSESKNKGGDSFEKQNKQQFPSLIAPQSLTKTTTTSLKKHKPEIQNVPYSDKNTFQTVVQSLHNPYVFLKRLNLRSIPNTSSQSQCKSTTHFDENDACNKNQSTQHANTVNLPQVATSENQTIINSENSAAILLPLLMTSVDCKFCSEHFNSVTERDIHEGICRLKRQFENIICVPCLLTFASSDELHAHTQAFHSTPFSTSDATKNRKPDDDDEVGAPKPKTKIEPESAIFSNEDLITDRSASAEVNISYGDLLDVVKTEYTTDANENSEIPDVDTTDTDPLESETHLVESPAAEAAGSGNVALTLPNSSDGNQKNLTFETRLPRYCTICEQQFVSFQDLTEHNQNYHSNPDGNRNFECQHPNCGKTTTTQFHLNQHLIHVHSTERPFKCPYPNCVKSFKALATRNKHMKEVHLTSSNFCEAETPKDTLQSGLFRFRYCFACKENFVSYQELTKHNQKHHGLQPGEQKFVCPHPNCGKTTKTRGNLTFHLLHVHSNERPFECSYPNCKAAFKSSSNLNKHSRRAHSTPGSSSNLSDGIRKDTESVECPYPNCGKIISSKWDLKTHVQQVHSNTRPYQCPHPKCTMSFKTCGSRKRHIEWHNKPFKP